MYCFGLLFFPKIIVKFFVILTGVILHMALIIQDPNSLLLSLSSASETQVIFKEKTWPGI